MIDHLICSNHSGEALGVIVEVNHYIYCKTTDGSVQELRPNAQYEDFQIMDSRSQRSWRNPEFFRWVQASKPESEYGSFYKLITDSHLQWSLRNPEFLRSVNSSDKAGLYVQQHRWPH